MGPDREARRLTRTQRHIEACRKGDAGVEVRDASGRPRAGVAVSVEQESHDFVFGCVVPDLNTLSDAERQRYRARLAELFNRVVPAEPPPSAESGVLRVDVAERVHLGALRLRLDDLAADGLPLQVHVWGEAAGMTEADERAVGRRVAELYTLCFAHRAVEGLFWNGFADGERGARGGGLLRRDLAPKYAHKALQKLIGFDWHTRAAGRTDAGGVFRFRGFYGRYRVVTDVGGPTPDVQTLTLRGPSCPGAKS
jgi:hypothetical protein